MSVIIPVFNAEKYLQDTLESILNQTFRDIEILCVDDGSMDQSLEIMLDYSVRDNRIKILQQKKKSDGAALARNLGLEFATGEYIIFLDADDLFEPDLIEKSYQAAKEKNADAVTFGAYFYHSETRTDLYDSAWRINSIFFEDDTVNPMDYPTTLFQRFKGSAWVYLFRRKYIVERGISFYPVHVTDDIEFTYMALAGANRIAAVNKRLVHYRRDAANNQTSVLSRHPETGWAAFTHFKHTLEEAGLYEYFKVSFVNLMMHMLFDNYLRVMSTYKCFNLLFYSLKKEYLVKMGAYDIPDEAFDDIRLVDLREHIMHDSLEEFLIYRNYSNSLIHYDNPAVCLPVSWAGKSGLRLVLYGAGIWGRKVFSSLLGDGTLEISHWVDRDYKRYGYPIENPAVLKKAEDFDLIFIAILSRKICENVRRWLVEIGVKNEIIFQREY